MRLSILLPTHERPDTLRLAIESVLAQDFEDWELLVCGDGCGQATEILMAEFVERDPRILWFSFDKAPGFGYANRNRALAKARGDLIGFMAHDDLVFSDHWVRIIAAFDDPNIQLVYANAAWVADDGSLVPTVFSLYDKVVRERFVSMRDNRIPATCFVYRRAATNEIGLWNETLPRNGDLDLWSRLIKHYGEQSFRYFPVVSVLHFRAIWKTEEQPDPQNGALWRRLFEEPGRLPELLKTPIPAATLPQTVFHSIQSRQWEAAIRDACSIALETFAWEAEQAWAKSLRDHQRTKEKFKSK
jgi:glycosyltransferase involved in cell wall biosynthesis